MRRLVVTCKRGHAIAFRHGQLTLSSEMHLRESYRHQSMSEYQPVLNPAIV